MLQNLATGGHSWRVHGVELAQVLARNRPIGDGSEELWRELSARIEQAFAERVPSG